MITYVHHVFCHLRHLSEVKSPSVYHGFPEECKEGTHSFTHFPSSYDCLGGVLMKFSIRPPVRMMLFHKTLCLLEWVSDIVQYPTVWYRLSQRHNTALLLYKQWSLTILTQQFHIHAIYTNHGKLCCTNHTYNNCTQLIQDPVS